MDTHHNSKILSGYFSAESTNKRGRHKADFPVHAVARARAEAARMLDERKSLADEESAARTEPTWQSVDALPAEPLPCAVAPCSTFRCLASPMFLLVWGLVGLTYFPYVLWTVHVTLTSRACVVVFHVLLLLLLASYLMCVFTDPGTVPPEWHRAVSSDPQLAAQHRVCPRTGLYRPLRSHYCSVTRRVVLNM